MTTWRCLPRLLQVRRSSSAPAERTGRLDVPAGRRLALRSGTAIFLLVLLLTTLAAAQLPVSPAQTGTPKNSEVVSGTNAAVTATITPTAATRAHLYGATARCSAGTASLSLTDGGTTVWSSDSAFVTTTSKSVTWIPGYTSGVNAALVVTLGTCGANNTGTLDVQADLGP